MSPHCQKQQAEEDSSRCNIFYYASSSGNSSSGERGKKMAKTTTSGRGRATKIVPLPEPSLYQRLYALSTWQLRDLISSVALADPHALSLIESRVPAPSFDRILCEYLFHLLPADSASPHK